MMKNKVVSACLCGISCRYDGKMSSDKYIGSISVCPECLGGLQIPRVPCEIVGGDGHDVLAGRAKVIAKDGTDKTREYMDGAYKVLEIVRKSGDCEIILKGKSPSCGNGQIYDGTFSGRLTEGDGVCAALLKENGYNVKCE